MKHLLSLFFLIPLFALGTVTAAPVKGVVRDETGQPLAGVTITVKGTRTSVRTDAEGRFSLDTKPGDILVFSYVGLKTKEVTVDGTGDLAVELAGNTKNLNTVIVTALGIKRTEKSLTYSAQQIGGNELTTVKSDNLMNSLNGKIAGVTISPSASGIGGSTKVILRGNRSTGGGNQPLYVIDGVPMSNEGNPFGQPMSSTYGGNPEGGDGISNLNPEDIESMTILKGASAAALYGSQAANGVIVITTKKGHAGRTIINVNSSASLDKNAYTPDFQSNYGQTSAGAVDSWGPKINGSPDNLKQFFQTGNNLTNAVSLSGGTDQAQTYFSYTNTDARGVEPKNKLSRNNFNFHETAKFLNNKLTVDGNVNYITQQLDNSPAIGFYTNPLTGLYFFPRGMDISPYKQKFEFPAAPGGNGATSQNWPFHEDVQQNPWWLINRDPNENSRNRILLNASVKYDFTPWFSLQLRGNVDRTTDVGDQKYYAGTLPPQAAPNGNGSFNGYNRTVQQEYGDILGNFNIPITTDWKVDGVLGGSINDNITSGIAFGPSAGQGYGLFFPNLFTIQNIEVVYFMPDTNAGHTTEYTGLRIGSNIPPKPFYSGFSKYNYNTTFNLSAPEVIMTAAEVWFLKAEAALRGWSGAGDAQTDYQTGILTSMQQYGVDASAAAYISDATSKPANYVDYLNSANNSPALSAVTIKWDPAASNEGKLEKIITQKWLAMFPEGQEAWTEFRRTGYPQLFPVVVNSSGGTIDTKIQVRRLPYPQSEATLNPEAEKAGIQLLGGPDNGGTRLWWDVNKANF